MNNPEKVYIRSSIWDDINQVYKVWKWGTHVHQFHNSTSHHLSSERATSHDPTHLEADIPRRKRLPEWLHLANQPGHQASQQ